MGASGYDVPAVVVGLNATGLGLVRGLAPHCARVIALESDGTEPGVRTRAAEVRRVRDLADHDALVATLRALARELGQPPVLLLSADEHVVWASATRAALADCCRVLLPPPGVCLDLMFKDRFAALAARTGAPVPAGAFVAADDLAAGVAAAGLRYPLVVKPANKSGAWERRGLPKAFIVAGADELPAIARAARPVAPSLLVQEYLQGGDDRVYFCLYFAAPTLPEPVLFTGRKLLQWPPLRGSTAACEPAAMPDLEAFTRVFFGRLGVHGFASLEVKVAADGGFRIIEPTIGRPDLQSGVAVLNGVNFPMIAYLAALGRGAEAAAFARPAGGQVAWLNESSLWALLRAGAVSPAQIARLLRRRKGFALTAPSDPGVAAEFVRQRLAGLARGAWGWARRASQLPAASAAMSAAPRTRS